jgi:hypothetical protein
MKFGNATFQACWTTRQARRDSEPIHCALAAHGSPTRRAQWGLGGRRLKPVCVGRAALPTAGLAVSCESLRHQGRITAVYMADYMLLVSRQTILDPNAFRVVHR